MATTDKTRLADPTAEMEQAQAIASRYRCDYIDLREAGIDHDLFRSIPVDLMFRYNFVPLHAQNGTLEIALSDPRNLNLIDELTLLLNKKLRVKVATLSQISELLKKTEQSQRVLEEVTEGFALDVVAEEGEQDENLSIDKLTSADSDIAPVIKLVDTTIFNALERRAALCDAAHFQGLAIDDHFAHQSNERTGYRREARSAGRTFPRALQGPP